MVICWRTRLPRSARYRNELWKCNIGELPKNNLSRKWGAIGGLVAIRNGGNPRNMRVLTRNKYEKLLQINRATNVRYTNMELLYRTVETPIYDAERHVSSRSKRIKPRRSYRERTRRRRRRR